MKVAIMQPYFMPYAGYFRLFAAADLFVALDCVQFPRRGWVHRNRFTDENGVPQWLTVSLKKGDRDTTRICDLCFHDDVSTRLSNEIKKFPALKSIQKTHCHLADLLFDLGDDPTNYFTTTLSKMAQMLGFDREVIRSSTLNIDSRFKAQQRIIEIARQVGATRYINAPGGRDLYDEEAFKEAGLTLDFLSEYRGSFLSIFERVIQDGTELVADEINKNLAV